MGAAVPRLYADRHLSFSGVTHSLQLPGGVCIQGPSGAPGISGMGRAMQARARRHREQAEGLALSQWPVAGLAQNEEPGLCGGEEGGRGGAANHQRRPARSILI